MGKTLRGLKIQTVFGIGQICLVAGLLTACEMPALPRLGTSEVAGLESAPDISERQSVAAAPTVTVTAGSDVTTEAPASSVSLAALASASDGSELIYAWTKVSGGTATIANANSRTALFSASAAGAYVVRVTATSPQGAKASDTVTVTVRAAAPPPVVLLPPTVSAGPAKTIALPTSSVLLQGSAIARQGSITGVQWTKTAGGKAAIASPTAASTNVTGLEAGNYTFTLTARDSTGQSASAAVQVTVKAAPLTTTGTCAKPATDTTPTRGVMKLCPLGSSPAKMGYVEYLPPAYGSKDKWPLVIFLHGIGENGPGAPLSKIQSFGPNSFIRSGKELPFIVLSPQNVERGSTVIYDVEQINSVVNHAVQAYKVDPDRIHVMGLSLGGGGTMSYAAKYASRLASMTEICGGYNPPSVSTARTILDQGVAIWAVSAHNDPAANFDHLTRWFMNNVAIVLGGNLDLLHDLTRTPGVLDGDVGVRPGSAGGPIAVKTRGDLLPKGTFSATFDESAKRWRWKNGQDYLAPNGTQPEPRVAFTIYTDVADAKAHLIWDRMFQDARFWKWVEAQSR